MDEIKTSLQYFSEGYNCSQSILMSFSPRFNLPIEVARKISAPFGAGIGRLGSHCGAVSGAIMALGLAYGFSDPQDQVAKDRTYAFAADFIARFKIHHHSIYCRDLLGLDISIPDQLAAALEQQAFTRLCPGFVQDAATILIEMLDSNP